MSPTLQSYLEIQIDVEHEDLHTHMGNLLFPCFLFSQLLSASAKMDGKLPSGFFSRCYVVLGHY